MSWDKYLLNTVGYISYSHWCSTFFIGPGDRVHWPLGQVADSLRVVVDAMRLQSKEKPEEAEGWFTHDDWRWTKNKKTTVAFFSASLLFFLLSAFLLLGFSAFPLFCFLVFCFSASLLFCCSAFLLLCFSASMLFCFPAFVLLLCGVFMSFCILCSGCFCVRSLWMIRPTNHVRSNSIDVSIYQSQQRNNNKNRKKKKKKKKKKNEAKGTSRPSQCLGVEALRPSPSRFLF